MHPLSERYHAVLNGLGKLHDKKQADYGKANDPFANVRQGAEAWGLRPWVAAMVRASDKMARIQAYASTGTLENEGVEDSFRDLAVYTVIALVLWEEEQDKPLEYTPLDTDCTCRSGCIEGGCTPCSRGYHTSYRGTETVQVPHDCL